MKLLGALVFTALLFALPARADTFYDISGTATLTGDNSCNGPCVEILTFSFRLDEQPVPCGDLIGCQGTTGYDALFADNLTLSASGPLGTVPSGGTGLFVDDKYLAIDFDQSPGEEFDFTMNPFPPPGFPFAPTGIGGFLYSCLGAACNGFCPLTSAPAGCVSQDATMQVSIIPVGDAPPAGPTQTPEPATWALLSLGLSMFIPLKLRSLVDSARRLTG